MHIGAKDFGVILVGAALAALAACSGVNNSPSPTSGSTPTPTPSATPTPTPTPTPTATNFVNINSPSGTASQPVGFTVTSSFDAVSNITFTFATSDGTAVAGTDYTAAAGTATITAGANTTTIFVNTALSSGSKAFNMTISAPTGASLGTTVTGVATMHVPPAFQVVITTTPENGGGQGPVEEALCGISIGTPGYGAGSVIACTNAPGALKNAVSIPEGRLYFGNLGFQLTVGVQTGNPVCLRGTFHPYYYLANNSSTSFTAPWTGTAPGTDCTKLPTALACYGGIAQDIVPGFPQYGGIYFFPSVLQPSTTWTSKSANSHTYNSNRYAVNNLAARGAAITFPGADVPGDGFVGGAGNYHDYVFDCEDAFEQPVYEITLTITDQDIIGVYPNGSQGNRNINQFPDWDPAAWDLF